MRKKCTPWLLLLIILLLAASLRFTHVAWDELRHLHPDERFLSMVINDVQWPNSMRDYFNSQNSTLSPYNTGKTFFVYGTFPVFLTKMVGDSTGFIGYDKYTFVGRILSGLFDMLTIIIIFLIAKELFDTTTALFSAFSVAAMVIHIQHSHFFVVDLFATFFVVLSFYLLVLLLKTRRLWYAPLVGISWGLALACKVSAAFFAVPIFVGCILMLILNIRNMRDRKSLGRIARSLCRMLLIGLVILATAFVMFRVFQPYAFDGPHFWNVKLSDRFKANMQELSMLHSKSSGYIPVLQWRDKTPFIQVKNLTLWEIGLPLSIITWLGVLLGIYRLIIKRDLRFLLLVVWVVFMLVFHALQFVKFSRYLLPATPFLAIFAGYLMQQITRTPLKRPKWRIARNVLVVIFILSCLLWPLAFTNVYAKGVSRIRAYNWAVDTIPANTTVANEPWDDNLWPPGTNNEVLALYEADTGEKIKTLSEQLSRTDYVFITSNRVYMVIPTLPEHPYATRYYDLLFNGTLGFKLEKTFTNYPGLFGIEINDDNAVEAFTVYDHPKVLIFKKYKKLNSTEIEDLIKGVK